MEEERLKKFPRHVALRPRPRIIVPEVHDHDKELLLQRDQLDNFLIGQGRRRIVMVEPALHGLYITS